MNQAGCEDISRKIRMLNVHIIWTNLQLFWYCGYGPVALATVAVFAPSKVL